MTLVREARATDCETVHNINLLAFPDSENQQVAQLAVDLLEHKSDPPTLSLLAEQDDEAVAYVAFSPVWNREDNSLCGYTLAPLAVKPGFQKQGLGSALIKNGIKRLSDQGVGLLFVYGDPAYYGRFGFDAEIALGYQPGHELQFPFGWQGMVLNGNLSLERPMTIRCVEPLDDPGLW